MAKKKEVIKEIEDGIDGAPPWITTFVDMVSLLVTFFILLYTFSSLRTYESFRYPKDLLGTRGVVEQFEGDTMEAIDEDLMFAMDAARGSRVRHSRPVDELTENVEQMGQKLQEGHIQVDLRAAEDGLRVVFDAATSFAPGSTEVNDALLRSLLELADAVEHYPVTLLIEGHTDDAFRPTPRHPDARALGVGRARAAADVLVQRGGIEPALVQLAGVGDERPLVPDARSAVERRRNRRVEVRIVAMSTERAARTAAGDER